jgi:hypothetical protein
MTRGIQGKEIRRGDERGQEGERETKRRGGEKVRGRERGKEERERERERERETQEVGKGEGDGEIWRTMRADNRDAHDCLKGRGQAQALPRATSGHVHDV